MDFVLVATPFETTQVQCWKVLPPDLDGKIRRERKELWITVHSRKSSAMLIVAVCLDCLCLPAKKSSAQQLVCENFRSMVQCHTKAYIN